MLCSIASLLPDTIHLWHINLTQLAQVTNAKMYLDNQERQRAARFHFEQHRARFIAAHYALRHILEHYLAIPAAEIIFETNTYGKPYISALQNSQQLQFNLSHSQEDALIGLRYHHTIGVDIEHFSPRDYMNLAKYAFSEHEVNALTQMSPEQQVSAFFHIWSQKEAFIKAVGQGLAYPLKDFSVAALPPAGLLEVKNDDKTRWFLHSFTPASAIAAAVASVGRVIAVRYFHFNDK